MFTRLLGRAARVVGGSDAFAFLTFNPNDPGSGKPSVLGSELGLSNLGRRLTRRVLETGGTVIISDLAEEAASDGEDIGVGAAIAMPVQARGRTIGVATFFLADTDSLKSDAAGSVLERLRTAHLEAAPARRQDAEEPALVGAVPRRTFGAAGGSSDGRPLVDLVAAVVGEAMTRLDAEAGRADEMSEANRLKSEFVSVVSHELRGPLTYVMGFSEILAERDIGFEKTSHYAAEMQRESRRMLQIVNDLLDMSRMELGHLSVEPRDLAIATEIRQISRNVATSSDKHQIVDDCPPELIVRADPVRLWQVLQNLLTNAIRYSPDGGEIRVTAQRDPEMPGLARVSVADNGVGIAPEYQPRIFEKFYRVDGDLKTRVRGSGLGLAICQAIVEAQGGTIWVESELGRGSVFTFTVPLAS